MPGKEASLKNWLEGVFHKAEAKADKELKPLSNLGLAIMEASTKCRDGIKPLIKASAEKERMNAEIYAFHEFVYFFMHIIMRNAVTVMSADEIKHLQAQLGPFVASVTVDSYCAHWPDKYKAGMKRDFYQNLNTSEIQYAECSRFETGGPRDGRSAEIADRLFILLGKQVASAIGQDGDRTKVIHIASITRTEWKRMDFIQLLNNFKRNSMGLPPPPDSL